MPHDATKVLMGATQSNHATVTTEDADPATFVAGLAVRRKSDGGLQVADDGTAALIGVSLGPDLSDSDKTAVCREGNRVPLRLRVAYATLTVNGDLTFTAVDAGEDGDNITITLADTATAGAETVGVTGTDIVIGIQAGVSTATQIKAAFDAETDATALATCAIVDGQDAETQAAAAEANLAGGADSADSVAIGAVVYVDDTTGEACDSGDDNAVATSAVYVSGEMTGVYTDGTTHPVALIDMAGGL